MARTVENRGKRGRLPNDARSSRREEILDAALDELLEHGVEGLTMLGVARRAGASKETLYAWFEHRDGLITALIERNADAAAERVSAALEESNDGRDTLVGFAVGLLSLLISDVSVALNRAAMSSPELARRLLRSGRHRVGPIAEAYLATLAADGSIEISEPSAAFELFYGLVVQDTQIRVLLGDPPPDGDAIARRASHAVDAFFTLNSPT